MNRYLEKIAEEVSEPTTNEPTRRVMLAHVDLSKGNRSIPGRAAAGAAVGGSIGHLGGRILVDTLRGRNIRSGVIKRIPGAGSAIGAAYLAALAASKAEKHNARVSSRQAKANMVVDLVNRSGGMPIPTHNPNIEKTAEKDQGIYEEYVRRRMDVEGGVDLDTAHAAKLGALAGVGYHAYRDGGMPNLGNSAAVKRFASRMQTPVLVGAGLGATAGLVRGLTRHAKPQAQRFQAAKEVDGVWDYERGFVPPSMGAMAGGGAAAYAARVAHIRNTGSLHKHLYSKLPHQVRPFGGAILGIAAAAAGAKAGEVAANSLNSKRSDMIRQKYYE